MGAYKFKRLIILRINSIHLEVRITHSEEGMKQLMSSPQHVEILKIHKLRLVSLLRKKQRKKEVAKLKNS